jgi:hypothetical protein
MGTDAGDPPKEQGTLDLQQEKARGVLRSWPACGGFPGTSRSGAACRQLHRGDVP